MKFWVDLLNPSHVLFFRSLLSEFGKDECNFTLRDRAETVELAKMLGIGGRAIGSDSKDPLFKASKMIGRTLWLHFNVNDYDYALSFENGSSVAVSKWHGKKSILMCDNDLKFLQSKSPFQSVETYLKTKADYIIVPEACGEAFQRHASASEVFTFPGLKEDVYIADYVPNPRFNELIPLNHFVVIRPEALGSFYVKERKTMVPELLRLFNREGLDVVYLPRDNGDITYVSGYKAFIPPKVIHGLDLCYHADAVLTGSGTMAREAACMGKTAVSFFPSDKLLSVDRELVEQGLVFHSRNPKDIVEYVISHGECSTKGLDHSKQVKNIVIDILNGITNVN